MVDSEKAIIDEVLKKYGNLDCFELNSIKQLRILSELCYKEESANVVPNELIERVFDYYTFYNLDVVRDNEIGFQKRLKDSLND